MKKIILITSCVLVVSLLSFAPFNINPEQKSTKTVKEGIYTYEIVEDDPLGMRLYTLANGLKIYLSVNKDEPRIQTTIAVKAGSTYDPSDATGLAHYLEHMLFKGSGDIGTKDWEAEKVLLEQISDLYELHKNTVDPDKKISIYKKIDSISYLASELAIANEYDKMAASIGATGTNAWTSFEQTVYTNNIPSNELEKWLMLERERFSMLVLRLFHTELEAVYEEFNRSQDNDGRKVRKEMLAGLFQQHKYGKQTTLGTSDHLKNPSMVKIHEYFDTYYVPNNMAICLSGDLNPLKTVQLIDKYFGTMEAKEVPPLEEVEEKPIRRIITKNVLGPSREGVTIAFRFDGKNSDDEMMITLVDMMLNNAAAGIIDLDLVQQQKVLSAGSYPSFMNDYGMQVLWGNPREGQTLEEVRDLLLGALEKIKKGDFEESMISVVGKNLRLLRIQTEETNGIAYDYVDAFTSNTPWEDYINFLDNLIAIRKSEVVEFVNKRFKDNYVIVYKRTGEDPQVAKVVKP
ncbi:MAG: insulinase family protein, partial [Bacteroidetes bacterium]|nr:insulinase family protein [Bacteroidota bacterium]